VIPLWKVRREALRLWRMLLFVPLHPVEQAWFRLHPRLFPDAYSTLEGQVQPSDAVAVFLIYQPGGVQDTVLTACRHLGDQGYSVHLVSNAPLCRADLDRLVPLCTRIVERPNHGLDFGGYRQAILDLERSGQRCSRLLLLNDSIWFPVVRGCDLLQRLAALDADLAGPVYYDHRTPHRAHLQSYMMLFSARALRSAAFRSFWRGYAMSNNKLRTIRNGEMRLTHVCRRAGLSVAALRSAHEAPDLDALSQDLRDLVHAYDRLRVSATAPRATARRKDGYVLTNHPLVNLTVLDLPFLKKDAGVPYRHQRAAMMAPDLAGLRARLDPAVVRAIARRDAPHADPTGPATLPARAES
jgi:hypothetical protein